MVAVSAMPLCAPLESIMRAGPQALLLALELMVGIGVAGLVGMTAGPVVTRDLRSRLASRRLRS